MDVSQVSDDRLKILKVNRFFRTLDLKTLEVLAREGRWKTYEPGRTLFQQGDECNYVLIVAEGRVTLSFASENGREVIVGEIASGDVIGEVELVLKRDRLTNGFASETTKGLSLHRDSFVRLLQNQTFSVAMLEAVCLRWCRLALFAEAMSLRSLEQRLASLLLDLCRTYGKPVRDGMLIDHSMSQTQMARLINASRPKVNVHLHAWKDRAWIGLERSRIVVRDAKALQQIATVASQR